MGCNCGKKKKAALAASRTLTASADTTAKPTPIRPAVWTGAPKETKT